MSQLISSAALRQLKTLSNSIYRLQTCSGSRYFSAVANKNIFEKRSEPTLLKPINISQVPQRSLYEQDSLGLEKVMAIREAKLELYQSHKDRYIERLASYLKDGNSQSILKDDLTNLIGLSENEQHLDLLEKIIASLKSEHDQHLSGWGTAVMRLYCTLNQVDRAYNNLKDQERFGDFFNQYTAYKVALTMLYNAGRYDDVIEIYNLARRTLELNRFEAEKQAHISGLAIVAFASLAKINTSEALERAERMYNETSFTTNGRAINYTKMRYIIFLSYMALEQDKPTLAINLISDAKGRNYVALRELKTLALLRLKRFEDITYHLRDSITRSKDSQSRGRLELILREVVEKLLASISEIQDEAIRQTLEDTLAELKQADLIGDTSLESIVFAPLKPRRNLMDNIGKQQTMDRQRYAARSSYNRFDPRSDDMMADANRFGQRNQRQTRYQPRDEMGGRRGYYNDRQQRPQGKSYFEEDFEGDDDDDAISTQKRFR